MALDSEDETNNTTADKDSSFNISDIVSYTIDEKSNTPASSEIHTSNMTRDYLLSHMIH